MATRSVNDRDADLAVLDAELRRLTRRADRQRRRITQTTEAWQRWSATIDEGLGIVGRIERAPISDLAGLTIVFQAILWRIRTDEDVIMDEAVRRALKRFGRQLSEMTALTSRAGQMPARRRPTMPPPRSRKQRQVR